MAIVILEGPDGAGKTTLAERLVSAPCPFPMQELTHTTQPTHVLGAYFEYLEQLEVMMSLKPQVLQVYDRFHLGEMVYGPIFRGRSDIDERQCRLIDSLLAKMGAVKVLCDAPKTVLVRRAFERGEDFVTNEQQLGKIVDEYRRLAGPDWLRVNTQTTSTYEAAVEVWKAAKESDVRRLIHA